MSEGLRWESGAGDVPGADPRHDLLAALDVVRSGLEWVREATARAWSLSEDELRESVAALYAARGAFEASTLAAVLVLDGRPEAVPGAPLDRAASTFLQQRMRLDPRQATTDVRAAHVLDAADGELPLVGAALAAGEISREHADACVKAVARLPRRLLTITVVDEESGETVSGDGGRGPVAGPARADAAGASGEAAGRAARRDARPGAQGAVRRGRVPAPVVPADPGRHRDGAAADDVDAGGACPAEGVDVHHLHAWQHGGATDLADLGSFCERHHQMLHLGIGEARVVDGRLHVRLPAWIDPQERWLRHTFHQSHEAAARLGQQLALALGDTTPRAEYDLRTAPDLWTWHRDDDSG